MDYSVHRQYQFRPLLMAFTLIVVGLVTVQFRYDSLAGDDGRNLMRLIAGLVLIFFGLLILLPRFRSIMPALGLMCLGIGISRAILGITYAMKKEAAFVLFKDLDYMIWVFGYITIAFSLYMIYRGFNFMRMNAMNAFVMRFTTMGIAIGYTLVMVYADVFVGMDTEFFWEYRRDFLTSPFLYLVYFVLLCSKEVYDLMYWEKIRKTISKVADRLNPGLLTASAGEYDDFRDCYEGRSPWRSAQEDSPVELQLSLHLRAEGPDMALLLEKWRGSDRVTYTLVPGDGGPYVAAQRGTVDRIDFGEHGFSLYNPSDLALRVEVQGTAVDVEEMEDEMLEGEQQ